MKLKSNKSPIRRSAPERKSDGPISDVPCEEERATMSRFHAPWMGSPTKKKGKKKSIYIFLPTDPNLIIVDFF